MEGCPAVGVAVALRKHSEPLDRHRPRLQADVRDQGFGLGSAAVGYCTGLAAAVGMNPAVPGLGGLVWRLDRIRHIELAGFVGAVAVAGHRGAAVVAFAVAAAHMWAFVAPGGVPLVSHMS